MLKVNDALRSLGKYSEDFGVNFDVILSRAPELRVGSIDEFESAPDFFRNKDIVDVLYESWS